MPTGARRVFAKDNLPAYLADEVKDGEEDDEDASDPNWSPSTHMPTGARRVFGHDTLPSYFAAEDEPTDEEDGDFEPSPEWRSLKIAPSMEEGEATEAESTERGVEAEQPAQVGATISAGATVPVVPALKLPPLGASIGEDGLSGQSAARAIEAAAPAAVMKNNEVETDGSLEGKEAVEHAADDDVDAEIAMRAHTDLKYVLMALLTLEATEEAVEAEYEEMEEMVRMAEAEALFEEEEAERMEARVEQAWKSAQAAEQAALMDVASRFASEAVQSRLAAAEELMATTPKEVCSEVTNALPLQDDASAPKSVEEAAEEVGPNELPSLQRFKSVNATEAEAQEVGWLLDTLDVAAKHSPATEAQPSSRPVAKPEALGSPSAAAAASSSVATSIVGRPYFQIFDSPSLHASSDLGLAGPAGGVSSVSPLAIDVSDEDAMAWLSALTPRRATMAAGLGRPRRVPVACAPDLQRSTVPPSDPQPQQDLLIDFSSPGAAAPMLAAPMPGMELMAQALADAAAKKAAREREEREAAERAANEANDAAAKAMAMAAEATDEWMEATDLFLSPSGNGGALPLASATNRNGGVVMPRLSFFLRTPEQCKAGAGADSRRISYAFRASQQDQQDVEAWLASDSPMAAPRKLGLGGKGGGLISIEEGAGAEGTGAEAKEEREEEAKAATLAPSAQKPTALGARAVTAASSRPQPAAATNVKPASGLRAPPVRKPTAPTQTAMGSKSQPPRPTTAPPPASKPAPSRQPLSFRNPPASKQPAAAPSARTAMAASKPSAGGSSTRTSALKRPSALPAAPALRTQPPSAFRAHAAASKRPTKP